MKKPFARAATKAALRADAMARRDRISAEDRAAGSAAMALAAIAILDRLKPGVVAVYRPIRSEAVPDAVIDWAHSREMVVVLPAVVDATTMAFRRFRAGDPLVRGSLGTMAPGPAAAEFEPDAIVLPMVGFDRTGVRLGHGGGYYDRKVLALRGAGVTPALVGLAFAVQEVSGIPAEAHDIRMDWIVTEKETIDFRHLG
jgi:5-formyltetrahydrofolate cyclo-ligase